MPDDGRPLDRQQVVRIATWNVLYDNRSSDRIVEFLDTAGVDVAALQELSEDHLRHVESLGRWHVARSPDQTNARVSSFLAIVSRTPVQSWTSVPVSVEIPGPRSPFARLKAATGTETALHAGLAVRGQRFQVLNLHLTCAVRPGERRRERMAGIAALSADGPAVILGDFNAMARRWINPAFAIPFGFRPADLFLNELAEVTAWAAGHGFVGAAQGITFPPLGLQLDQIFVRGMTVVAGRILKHRFGSDHRPVIVDLAM